MERERKQKFYILMLFVCLFSSGTSSSSPTQTTPPPTPGEERQNRGGGDYACVTRSDGCPKRTEDTPGPESRRKAGVERIGSGSIPPDARRRSQSQDNNMSRDMG